MATREMRLAWASHRLLRALEDGPPAAGEELVFIPFRPAWLCPQRRVYEALRAQLCHICMYEYYVECIARQHERAHPAICVRCYVQLRRCPFCRLPLLNFCRAALLSRYAI